jgi:hypothetical protein
MRWTPLGGRCAAAQRQAGFPPTEAPRIVNSDLMRRAGRCSAQLEGPEPHQDPLRCTGAVANALAPGARQSPDVAAQSRWGPSAKITVAGMRSPKAGPLTPKSIPLPLAAGGPLAHPSLTGRLDPERATCASSLQFGAPGPPAVWPEHCTPDVGSFVAAGENAVSQLPFIHSFDNRSRDSARGHRTGAPTTEDTLSLPPAAAPPDRTRRPRILS